MEHCCSTDQHNNHNNHNHDHNHDVAGKTKLQLFGPAIISFVILAIGLILDYGLKPTWFANWPRIALYAAAYFPVGWPVIKEAFTSILKGDVFSEFFLMAIATIGAIAIGEYPEAVAVMLFYSVGEIFQGMAVQKAKSNIASLIDQRPDEVTIIENGVQKIIKAKEVLPGQKILLKPGEKLALDGELSSEKAAFNTAALTGESKPDTKMKGEEVLAGMININSVAEVLVKSRYNDSKLSKILELVQNANQQKAPTELFIRKFAKIYTPIVTFLALGIFLLPYLFVDNYDYKVWLYRACVFLVISCPCALVISIPLGYFGGIGAASKHGILFKGGNFIDALASIKNVVMDKTGTITEGIFKVKTVHFSQEFNQDEMLDALNVLENHSTHPIATAIHDYVGTPKNNIDLNNIEEIAGHGLKAEYQGATFLAGNFKLMDKFNIKYHVNPSEFTESLIAVAYKQSFVGYITIADQIKEDAQKAINELKSLNINTFMLSGDKKEVVDTVAQQLNIDHAYGGLLPEDKVKELSAITTKYGSAAFVGDGVNDAPVVALADVGMAMGGLGSDATIETADVVIQDDKAAKIPLAIKISKATRRIVWQNVALAFGVKAIVLILGAGGVATMWEAVFADVGVALLAILNAVRIQNKNFN